jgi:hypothetical protein
MWVRHLITQNFWNQGCVKLANWQGLERENDKPWSVKIKSSWKLNRTLFLSNSWHGYLWYGDQGRGSSYAFISNCKIVLKGVHSLHCGHL